MPEAGAQLFIITHPQDFWQKTCKPAIEAGYNVMKMTPCPILTTTCQENSFCLLWETL